MTIVEIDILPKNFWIYERAIIEVMKASCEEATGWFYKTFNK